MELINVASVFFSERSITIPDFITFAKTFTRPRPLPQTRQTGICMEIYLTIDKMVKMYKNSYYSIFLCCFLTVSCPINAILASFNGLVSQLLRKIQGKTRLYYAARRKSYKNHVHSTRTAPKLYLSTESWFSFPEKISLVPNIKPWPQEGEKCRNLNLPRP